MKDLIPSGKIISKIYLIRGMKVMLDRDLAELYDVETKRLKEQVKRNISRFPADFMFILTEDELENWRSQFATSNSDKRGLRYAPMAFTEHGVAMLSSVLNSKRAIEVNIQIIRAFNHLKKAIISNDELKKRILQMEEIFDVNIRLLDIKIDKNTGILFEKIKKNTEKIQLLFDLLISPDFEPDKINQIGFEIKEDDKTRKKKK